MTRAYALRATGASMRQRAACENCKRIGSASLHIKLDPVTFRVADEKCLCTPCAKRDGYTPKYRGEAIGR